MGGGGGKNPEKTTWHTHKQNLSPVIVRLINWAANYDEVFIVLVMVVAKAILLFFKKKKKKKKKKFIAMAAIYTIFRSLSMMCGFDRPCGCRDV